MNNGAVVILAVDDNPNNLKVLFDLLDTHEFEVLTATSGEIALKRLEHVRPDMILLDVRMPGIDGFETCRRLKSGETTREIPVIFMTALTDTEDKVKGFEVGAVDYITKPFQTEEVLARVTTHLNMHQLQRELRAKNALLADRERHLRYLVDEKTQHIEHITLALVNALEQANALNDADTGQHLKRIGVYSAFLAEKYGCEPDFVKRIKLYAPLHDVGKVGLPDAILKKTGKYTPKDYHAMQQHVVFGAHLLDGRGIDVMARNIALYHHEKWDGSGYVHHLSGDQIPLEARIVALADVYDALSSKRAYKEAFAEDKVDQIIQSEAGKHFDPQLVEVYSSYKSRIETIKHALTGEHHE